MQPNSPAEILKKVRRIEIRTRRMVTDAMAGAYHSAFKGRGMDFEEVREYQAGDDVRSIDWNVTARMNRPFLKKYREERELTLLLMVDLSASGFFGSELVSKRELAAEVASVLAFSAARNNDKVGLRLVTGHNELLLHPRKGRSHTLRLIRDILFYEPTGHGTNLIGALETVSQVLRRRAVVFLITDMIDGASGRLPDPRSREDKPLFNALDLANRRHDLSILRLSDPREFELPDVGVIHLEDPETGRLLRLDTSQSDVRDTFYRTARRQSQSLARGLQRLGIGALELSTVRPYEHDLRRYFERRRPQR